MGRYLVDVPLMASLWVTADTEEDALQTVNVETKCIDLDVVLRTETKPAVLFQLCRTGEPECIEEDDA